nr:hypothetical protein [uncultured Flavobacterium sp.]
MLLVIEIILLSLFIVSVFTIATKRPRLLKRISRAVYLGTFLIFMVFILWHIYILFLTDIYENPTDQFLSCIYSNFKYILYLTLIIVATALANYSVVSRK